MSINNLLDDHEATKKNYKLFIDSITKPWNLMYYDKNPLLNEYLDILKKNNIPFENKSLLSKSLINYEIYTRIDFTDLDNETIRIYPNVKLNTKENQIISQYITDFGLNQVSTNIYQALKWHDDYQEKITETGILAMYNSLKRLWISLSKPIYDSQLGREVSSILLSFEKF